MKTFARLIWRYVLTAVGVVLLLLVLTISLLGWISWREGYLQPQREYSYSEIADSMVETDNGMIFGAEHAPEEWMDGYAWAMILDEKGNVKWNYDLPDELDNHYSSSDIASFSRWYLDDYPVFCWSEDYGLFVAGLTKGSLWKYNLYNSPNVLQDSEKKLGMVDKAEQLLLDMGFHQVRVRIHGNIARIEVLPDEITKIVEEGNRTKIANQLKEYGFDYVTLDLLGYRTGSMNETLDEKEKEI